MRLTRIFCANKLQPNTEIALNNSASHHILYVLRLKLGAKLIIFNGTGGEYSAELSAVNNKTAVVKLIQFHAANRESPLKIHLAQSLAKGDKMDFIIQKAVELGVYKITPLITERSNVKLDNVRMEKKMQHWRAIIISACEQSGRNKLPIIEPIQHFPAWINQQHDGIGLILAPQATTTKLPSSAEKTILLIGPEGGLNQLEEHLAQQNSFIPLNLGPRILRTETASLAAISIIQSRFGDM